MEGDQMKMREALLKIETVAGEAVENGTIELPQYSKIVDIVESALSAPARNCDVGTAEEQVERFDKFCDIHDCKSDCPLFKAESCEFAWSQMPYEAKEGEGDESK